MKITRKFLFFLFPFLLCITCHATGEKDSRLIAISAAQLQKSILDTPSDLPLQLEIVLRARHSHLSDVAYKQYTALWKQKMDDADTNLLRGVSAEYLAVDSLNPSSPSSYKKYKKESLFSTASSCLERAVKFAPDSAVANMEEGFFLWQYGEKLPQGITYLRKSLHLAPRNPRVHAMLGDVYANPSGGNYNIQEAITQLDMAVALDPSYAFPHDLLSNIYARLGQDGKAKVERDKYQGLIP